MNKNQSAFSLIEVMVSLLILSIVLSGTGVMLLESARCYKRAEFREKALTFAWSIAESLHHQAEGSSSVLIEQYWQEKLDVALPGSVLEIKEDYSKVSCVYAVVIQFPDQDIAELELQIAI